MTGQPQTPNQFNTRADNAALALRQDLLKRGAEIPDSGAVEVDADGKPPAPLPPEGSYQRMAIEQQRAAQQQIGDQPPAGTTEQMVDGSQAPVLQPTGIPPQETPAEPAQELSPNAQQRIGDLINQLRQKDQDLQQALAAATGLEDLKVKFSTLEEQNNQMIQANLDTLDPETRMAVMQNAQLQEQVTAIEQRILGQVMPHVNSLQQENAHTAMVKLGEKYPAFDLQIHQPLVDSFRAKNPACSIEQAYRAIAEGDELVTRATAPATAVPPIVPPGSGSPRPRYVPEPTAQSDPEQELVEEAQTLKGLMASQDPADHRKGLRLADQNIARRLAHRLPGAQ